MASTATSRVLQAVQDERWRQVSKWGEQHHGDSSGEMYREAYEGLAGGYKTLNDHAVAVSTDPSWDTILLEEVYEALAESKDPAALRAELVQVAAVAVAWIEDIDSRPHARG